MNISIVSYSTFKKSGAKIVSKNSKKFGSTFFKGGKGGKGGFIH
jgi:hypothetical protein